MCILYVYIVWVYCIYIYTRVLLLIYKGYVNVYIVVHMYICIYIVIYIYMDIVVYANVVFVFDMSCLFYCIYFFDIFEKYFGVFPYYLGKPVGTVPSECKLCKYMHILTILDSRIQNCKYIICNIFLKI